MFGRAVVAYLGKRKRKCPHGSEQSEKQQKPHFQEAPVEVMVIGLDHDPVFGVTWQTPEFCEE